MNNFKHPNQLTLNAERCRIPFKQLSVCQSTNKLYLISFFSLPKHSRPLTRVFFNPPHIKTQPPSLILSVHGDTTEKSGHALSVLCRARRSRPFRAIYGRHDILYLRWPYISSLPDISAKCNHSSSRIQARNKSQQNKNSIKLGQQGQSRKRLQAF